MVLRRRGKSATVIGVSAVVITVITVTALAVALVRTNSRLRTAVALLEYNEAKNVYYNARVNVSGVCDVGAQLCTQEAGYVTCGNKH